MLKGATIVVFADDWGAHPSSAQHLFRRFLGQNHVAWVNTVGQRLPRPTLRDAKKLIKKIGTWARPAAPNVVAGPGLAPEVIDVALLPLALGKVARKANRKRLVKHVRAALEKGSGEKYIVTTLPITADIRDEFPDVPFVFYVVDDYASWPGMANGVLRDMDAKQAAEADLVVAASRSLASMHAGVARVKPALCEHGVDVEHFMKARRLRAEAEARGEKPGADLIFFGALDERIDQDLFVEVARARRELKFLFVGPRDLKAKIAGEPNIEQRDAVPYSQLPEVLAGCRAVFLPYVGGVFGQRISPLKAREALAAGLPIAGTDILELKRFEKGVFLGRTADEIIGAVDRALAAPDSVPGEAELQRESWGARAEGLADLLAQARPAARRKVA